MFSKPQAIAIARCVTLLRPDWDFHGIAAALARLELTDPFTAAIIAITAAADHDAETPMAMTNPIYAPDYRLSEQTERDYRRHQDIEAAHSAQVLAELHARKITIAANPPRPWREIAADMGVRVPEREP